MKHVGGSLLVAFLPRDLCAAGLSGVNVVKSGSSSRGLTSVASPSMRDLVALAWACVESRARPDSRARWVHFNRGLGLVEGVVAPNSRGNRGLSTLGQSETSDLRCHSAALIGRLQPDMKEHEVHGALS
jgi:hypothetical protein